MAFEFIVTFDLEDAEPKDYDRAEEVLTERFGLKIARGGKGLPSTTYWGRAKAGTLLNIRKAIVAALSDEDIAVSRIVVAAGPMSVG